MQSRGDFSLIIPSYNHGKYLRDLFSSIFGGETCLGTFTEQTLLPKEIIVVDDCSTDDTDKVLTEIGLEYPEIIHLRNSVNSGTPVSCNNGIRHASGKFITRIDADDMRESWSFQEMYDLQLNNPESMVYDDIMIFLKGQRKGKPWVMSEYDFDLLLTRNLIHAGIMFPKSAWVKCGGYPEEFRNGRDDWSFNVALGSVGCCGVHLHKPGYLYRREQQNRSLVNGKLEDQFEEMMHKKFFEIYSGRRDMACCGGRKSTSVNTLKSGSSRSMTSQMVGSTGMTELEYIGGNNGYTVYFGPVTGTAYRVSKSKNKIQVDNRDLHAAKDSGLLDLREHTNQVFKVAPVYVAPEPEPEPEVTQEVSLKEPVKEVDEEIVSSPEPSKGTPIESGQLSGVGESRVMKMSESGITTWEEFLATDSETLHKMTGLTVARIDEIKKEITQ